MGSILYPTTTTIPTTTTTPVVSEPDPYEYEKSTYRGNLTDDKIELLQDIVRLHHGRQTKLIRRSESEKLFIEPRSNETSRIRAELRIVRLIHRCGAGPFRRLTDAEEHKMHEAAGKRTIKLGDELDAMVRQARELTSEEVDIERERAELEKLKDTALRVRHESGFRYNTTSQFRFRQTRGEPIITSQFRETFNDYMRPPFVLSTYSEPLPRRNLPPIDKKNEIWAWPVDDEDWIPLYTQPKEVKPDKRSRKERARPPLKERPELKRRRKDKAISLQRVTDKGDKKRKIPWNYGAPKSPLMVEIRDLMRRKSSTDDVRKKDEGE